MKTIVFKGTSGRFNPRARGGRDKMKEGTKEGVKVSIHAPAGGATRPQSA